MAKDLNNILLSVIEENKIKEKTPDKLPLNPTAEGWSGQEVRRFLAKSLTDNEGSFLAEFKKKMIEIKAQFEDVFGDGDGDIQGQIDSIVQKIDEIVGVDGGDGVVGVDLIATMNKAINLENANMFKEVNYNNVNGVLTFTKYDNTTKEIDLPLELLVESGYYDEVTNELVLVLANASVIRIPVGNLLTDLDAYNIRFNGSDTNYLVNKFEVESAVIELDKKVKTNADIIDEKQDKLVAGNNITIDENTNVISATGGGGGISAFVGTSEEYNIANSDGQIPSGTLVIITDEEEIPNSSTTSVLGEAELGSMILGNE